LINELIIKTYNTPKTKTPNLLQKGKVVGLVKNNCNSVKSSS